MVVGGQSLVFSGYKVKMEVDIATNMGIKTSTQDSLILENDGEFIIGNGRVVAYFVGRRAVWRFRKNGQC